MLTPRPMAKPPLPPPPPTDWAKIDTTVKDVHIRNVPTYHDEEEGAKRGKNSVFVVEAAGLKFVHLGDLGHVLTQKQVDRIGPVDVLMVPIGGVYTLTATRWQPAATRH